MELSIGLVVVGALLQVVTLHLSRGIVAGIDAHAALVVHLVVDVVVVEDGLSLHTRLRLERLTVADRRILVGGHTAREHQLEDVDEEVHLRTDGFFRIIKPGVLCFVEVKLTIDVAPPHHILRHGLRHREGNLRPRGHVVGIRLLLLFLLLLLSAGSGLCHHGESDTCHCQYDCYSFHFLS